MSVECAQKLLLRAAAPHNPAEGLSSGVNVSRLIRPLRTIISAGFTPHIVTGNVPIAMSASPALGAFGFNNQPPASNAEYRRYMADVASGLVAEFGRDTVAGWRWGVFTEYNNADWLNASSSSFFELYDHTVCGLADELGSAADIDIGVHGCLQCTTPPSWDPGDFLRHAAVAPGQPSSPQLDWEFVL